jgi:membrane associated rhomboid family serine protease
LLRAQGPLLGLILVIFAIFVLQSSLGRGWYADFMVVPLEVVQAWNLLREGSFAGSVWTEFGTLLSYAFLHGDAEHVLYNMLFMWVFAALAAELLGHRWMLAIFVFTAITGGICHVALNTEQTIPMLGASGAVMGFEGAYLGMAVRWQLPDPHVWPIARPIPPFNLAVLAVIGIGFDYFALLSHAAEGVAYGAHVGGFIGGLFLTSFVIPMPGTVQRR